MLKIELSDSSKFQVKSCYLDPNDVNPVQWEENREISLLEKEMLAAANACTETEKAAMRLIAMAEQRRWGLNAKLEQRGYDSTIIKIVINRLLELNLVDDRRYAEIWLRKRIARQGKKVPGPQELRAKLQNRGIDRSTAELALSSVLDDEGEWSLLDRYISSFLLTDGSTPQRRQLRAEGFSPEVLSRFFND